LDDYNAEQFTPAELELRELAISNAAYHYLGSAKIMAQIGQAFAEEMHGRIDGDTSNRILRTPTLAVP